MMPAMQNELALVFLAALILLAVLAGGVIFYFAFRLGLVHGGVMSRAAGSQVALTGVASGAKVDGLATVSNKDSQPFPSFGDLVRENSSK